MEHAPAGSKALDIGAARQIVEAARKEGRHVLGEDEAKSMLAASPAPRAKSR